MKSLLGRVFSAPADVVESKQIKVVGQDSDPFYNPTRDPWFVQVREYQNGECIGSMFPVTLKEFQKWNPDVKIA